MDPIQALIEGQPTDADSRKAISASLRKQNMLGQLMQVSGDSVLSPLGSTMHKESLVQADALGQARLAAAKLASDERLRRAQMDFTNQYRGVQRADKLDRETRTSASKIGNALSKQDLINVASRLRSAKTTFAKLMDKKGQLPGISKLQSGEMAQGINRWLRDDVDEVWQAIEQIFNPLLKQRSGAAVTPHEYQRLKDEIMGAANEKAFYRGLNDLQRALQSEQDSILAANELGAPSYLNAGGEALLYMGEYFDVDIGDRATSPAPAPANEPFPGFSLLSPEEQAEFSGL